MLEMNDDCTIAKLNIYPGSRFETQAHVSTIKHLVVIRGSARTTIDNQGRLLNKGESVALTENQRVMLENDGNEPLNIMSIRLDF